MWKSNSDPNLVGRWYFDHLFNTQVIPSKLRMNRGTETGLLATLHVFLRCDHGDMTPEDTVEYGSFTSSAGGESCMKDLKNSLNFNFSNF